MSKFHFIFQTIFIFCELILYWNESIKSQFYYTIKIYLDHKFKYGAYLEVIFTFCISEMVDLYVV